MELAKRKNHHSHHHEHKYDENDGDGLEQPSFEIVFFARVNGKDLTATTMHALAEKLNNGIG